MFANQTVEFDTLGFSAGKDLDTLATAPPWAFGGWTTGGINQPPDGKQVKLVGLGSLGDDTSSAFDIPTVALWLGVGFVVYSMFLGGAGGLSESLFGTRTTVYKRRGVTVKRRRARA